MLQPATLREEIKIACFDEGGYPERWARHTACPCCGRVDTLKTIFEKYGINHDECMFCSFVCVNPFPPDEVLRKLYAGYYYTLTREHDELPRVLREGAQSAFSAPKDVLVDIIRRTSAGRSRGSWLDVGGGIGVFGSFIANELPNWDISINEHNPRSNALAKELFGLNILSPDPKIIEMSGQRFDVITAIMVLEHVVDPSRFIAAYASLLKPGGQFVVAVPNFTRMCADLAQASSPAVVPPFHVSFFSEKNLKLVFSRSAEFKSLNTEQFGAAACSLMQLADYADYWDITMPADGKPAVSLQTRPYPEDLATAINVLAEADAKLGDFFADRDGRMFLTLFAQI